MPSFANQYAPANTQFADRAVWERLNFLLSEVASLKEKVQNAGGGGTEIARLTTQIQAATDDLTQLQTYVGKGGTQFVSTDSAVSGSGVGLQLAGPGSSVVITVTNAATFRSAVSAAAKASPAIVAATIPLFKITGGGADGSISVNTEGIVTAYVAPT